MADAAPGLARAFLLDRHSQWAAVATGVACVERDAADGLCVVLRDAAGGAPLFSAVIRRDQEVARQQPTVVTWSPPEDDGADVALSFDSEGACDLFWGVLCAFLGVPAGADDEFADSIEDDAHARVFVHSDASDPASLGDEPPDARAAAALLPAAVCVETLGALETILVSAAGAPPGAMAARRRLLVAEAARTSLVERLVALFAELEGALRGPATHLPNAETLCAPAADACPMSEVDAEDCGGRAAGLCAGADADGARALAALQSIAASLRALFALGSPVLLASLLSDENAPGVAGAFEYEGASLSALDSRPRHRARLVGRSAFRSVVPIEDARLLELIHRTARAQYMRDAVLGGRPDDDACLALTFALRCAYADIVDAVEGAPGDDGGPGAGSVAAQLAALFRAAPDAARDADAVRFVREYVGAARASALGAGPGGRPLRLLAPGVLPDLLSFLARLVRGGARVVSPAMRVAPDLAGDASAGSMSACAPEVSGDALACGLDFGSDRESQSKSPGESHCVSTGDGNEAPSDGHSTVDEETRRVAADVAAAVAALDAPAVRAVLAGQLRARGPGAESPGTLLDEAARAMGDPHVPAGTRWALCAAVRALLDVGAAAAAPFCPAGAAPSPARSAADDEFVAALYPEAALRMLAPLAAPAPEGSRRVDAREAADALSALCDVLCLCVAQHKYRAKYLLFRSAAVHAVVALLDAPDAPPRPPGDAPRPYGLPPGWAPALLRMAAVRVLRAMVAAADDFYARFLVRQGLVRPVLAEAARVGARPGAYASALAELLLSLGDRRQRVLLAHVLELDGGAALRAASALPGCDAAAALRAAHDRLSSGADDDGEPRAGQAQGALPAAVRVAALRRHSLGDESSAWAA